MTVWYAGFNLRTRRLSTQSDINQVSHWYNNYPDDGHMAARNMYRIEINIHEKLWVKLVVYKHHTRTHGQQNIKKQVLNPLNAELNPICHLLLLLGSHHILHVSRIRVNLKHVFPNASKLYVVYFGSQCSGWLSCKFILNLSVRHDVVLTTVMHELLWVIASMQLKKYLLNKQD